MRAIVLGGTKGIGKSIVENLKDTCEQVIAAGSSDIDTKSLDSVEQFIKKYNETDVLVLNTGGPPDLKVEDIDDKIWLDYFNSLFLSFFKLIQKTNIKKGGYIFLISSFIVKQPGTELILSSSLRSGFVSLFKSLSKIRKDDDVSFINIAPGPIKTDRLVNLIKKDNMTLDEFSKTMPGKRVPDPDEIGLFVNFIIKNKIKSLNGVTIPFDSGLLESI